MLRPSNAGLIACAIPALVLIAGHALIPANPPHWQAVIEWRSGHSDIIEHGVTLPDCMASLRGSESNPRVSVSYCERIPQDVRQ